MGRGGSNTHPTPIFLLWAKTTIPWGRPFGGVLPCVGFHLVPLATPKGALGLQAQRPLCVSDTGSDRSALLSPNLLPCLNWRMLEAHEVLIRSTKCKTKWVGDCSHSSGLPLSLLLHQHLRPISPPLAKLFFKLWEPGAHSAQEAWPRMIITDREEFMVLSLS